MITPKATFKQSAHAKGWLTLTDGVQFRAAVAAANQEMDIQNQNSGIDLGNAAAAHWKKAGALQFLNILMNLTATTVTPKRPGTDNLRHDLK